MPYGLDCKNCPRGGRENCGTWGDSAIDYKYEGDDLMGKEWPKCPASYLEGSHLLIALELMTVSKVSPLQGWPSEWSAWVVKYLTGIHHAIEDRKLYEVQKNG
tara:strand:+ start:444 stop:752 length:309 start_codon:yes stop_codon:yes gene_type:complete